MNIILNLNKSNTPETNEIFYHTASSIQAGTCGLKMHVVAIVLPQNACALQQVLA